MHLGEQKNPTKTRGYNLFSFNFSFKNKHLHSDEQKNIKNIRIITNLILLQLKVKNSI